MHECDKSNLDLHIKVGCVCYCSWKVLFSAKQGHCLTLYDCFSVRRSNLLDSSLFRRHLPCDADVLERHPPAWPPKQKALHAEAASGRRHSKINGQPLKAKMTESGVDGATQRCCHIRLLLCVAPLFGKAACICCSWYAECCELGSFSMDKCQRMPSTSAMSICPIRALASLRKETEPPVVLEGPTLGFSCIFPESRASAHLTCEAPVGQERAGLTRDSNRLLGRSIHREASHTQTKQVQVNAALVDNSLKSLWATIRLCVGLELHCATPTVWASPQGLHQIG